MEVTDSGGATLSSTPAHRTRLAERVKAANRQGLLIVFFLGVTIIALEVISFQALSFVNDYLTATRVIAIAMIGIAAGGVCSYFARTEWSDRLLRGAMLCLPMSIAVSYVAIARLSGEPLLLMAVLTSPYLIASFCLSIFFNRKPPSLVYLFDLIGAGVGAILVVIATPFLREEGTFALLVAIAAVPSCLNGASDGGGRTTHNWHRWVGMSIALAAGLSIPVMVTSDRLNLLNVATVDSSAFPQKIFGLMEGRSTPRFRLLHSRGSLIERIDIIERIGTEDRGPSERRWRSVYNGRIVDMIDSLRAHPGLLDNRLPTHLRAGEDPDTLLVGPSGQGLTKAVQALGWGHIDAVEINGAIAGLMSNEMYDLSGRAYEGMNLTVGDVRTFLRRTDRKYDFITMLNTHRIWSMGHQGPPEFTHTLEAMRDYLAHLKDNGIALFEERNVNEQADLGIRRVLFTAKAAMKEMGIEHPEQNIGIWELYHNCTREAVESDPPACHPWERFTFLMMKRTPFTAAEIDHLLRWGDELGARPDKGMGYRGIVWRYLPGQPNAHYWATLAVSDDPYIDPATDPSRHDLSVVRDDRPFPYAVYREPGAAHRVVLEVALLAAIMVIIPAMLTFLSRRRDADAPPLPAARWKNSLLLGYFAALGIGYLVIEILLIQKFGIFLASPSYALAVVLATMLIGSGAGGYFSSRAQPRHCVIAMIGVLAGVAFIAFGIDAVLSWLMPLAFPLRILIAMLMIAPIAFAMGYPFPYAMSYAKRALSERHAGLLFGINGAVGATAAPLTLVWTMTHGFAVTALLAGGAYLICLFLFLATRIDWPAQETA